MKKTRPATSASAIRLPDDVWPQLRALMQAHHGRGWLVKIIEREHRKLPPEQQAKPAQQQEPAHG